MAVPKYIKLSNGAKLIYIKQNHSDITDMSIAFACGSNCDGEYPGISHFLEHMLFTGTKKFSDKISNKMAKHTLMQNAFTTESLISTNFNCINKELINTIKYNISMLTNKNFNAKQMANEIKVIEQEKNMAEDQQRESAMNIFMNTLVQDRGEDPLGSINALKKVTSQTLVEYMDKYFITENLIISVVTSKKLSEIKEIVEKLIVQNFVSNPENVVNPCIDAHYQQINPMIYLPNPEKKTVALSIMLRKDYPNTNEDDIAIVKILYTILNGVGSSGILFNKFRKEENQAKAYSSYYKILQYPNLDIDCFNIRTSPKSIKKATTGILEVINNLKNNGVSEKKFKDAVRTIINEEDAKKIKLIDESSLDMVFDYVYGINPIDENLVIKKIKELTYEDFNEIIKEKFNNQNIMATVEGAFDSRQCLTLAEMRKKLGYPVEKSELNAYNIAKIEYEPVHEEELDLCLEL